MIPYFRDMTLDKNCMTQRNTTGHLQTHSCKLYIDQPSDSTAGRFNNETSRSKWPLLFYFHTSWHKRRLSVGEYRHFYVFMPQDKSRFTRLTSRRWRQRRPSSSNVTTELSGHFLKSHLTLLTPLYYISSFYLKHVTHQIKQEGIWYSQCKLFPNVIIVQMWYCCLSLWEKCIYL
jgi:hypothetical protein